MMKKLLLFSIFVFLIIILFESKNSSLANTTNSSKVLKNGIYVISSENNKVLDVTKDSKENCANIEVWEKNNGNNQKFKIIYENGYYTIECISSGKYLDVYGDYKVKGTNVQQYEKNNQDNQKWIIKDAGNGSYYITSKSSNLNLDVYGGYFNNGTNIQIWTSGNQNNQKFKFELITSLEENNNSNDGKIIKPEKTIEEGTYAIKSAVNTNYGLDVYRAQKDDCANIELWKYNANLNQKFYVKPLADNYYVIINVNSNKALDVYKDLKEKGTNVEQFREGDTDNQKWIIKDAGNGCYNIISKSSNLYLDIYDGSIKNGTNIQIWDSNNLKNQKFKFEKVEVGSKTIDNGYYFIKPSTRNDFALDVYKGLTSNGTNIELWTSNLQMNQKFKIEYSGDSYYYIIAAHSNKAMAVNTSKTGAGANVEQKDLNKDDNSQKWIIKSLGNGQYSIISEYNSLYIDVSSGIFEAGKNIQTWTKNNLDNQKFKFDKTYLSVDIDDTEYPGYKDKIDELQRQHPTWTFKLLYTGLTFGEAVNGEYSRHSANLVPTSSGTEWICSECGTKLYDTGWYGASDKAIAYYMDTRNWLNENGIFQFLDANLYSSSSVSLEGIKNATNGTFLYKPNKNIDYSSDINTACQNKNVNPYYIISRLIQENGRDGSYTSNGMDGGDGKKYFNPFNIGASGNSIDEVKANALFTAKSKGWDSMEKALEGGINFLKYNWLDNYQNTLYQNKFDIDVRSGKSGMTGKAYLYQHQYAQNLLAAYNEGILLKGYYEKAEKKETELTFIIPVYEKMDTTLSQRP